MHRGRLSVDFTYPISSLHKGKTARRNFGGDALDDLSGTAALVCRNNHFGGCRARGLLVRTPQKVLIEGNLFESSGAAILVAGDSSDWFECGRCIDVKIRGNYFSDACLTSSYEGGDAVISIHPNIKKPVKEKPYHRNIWIEDNLFHTSDASVLYSAYTDGLVFRNNHIVRSYHYQPWKSGAKMFSFRFCSAVFLQ